MSQRALFERFTRGWPLLLFGAGSSGGGAPPPAGPPTTGGGGVRFDASVYRRLHSLGERTRKRPRRDEQWLAKGRLLARGPLRVELARRERRLLAVVRQALADVRRVLSVHDLRLGAVGGGLPALEGLVLARWERYRAAMVAALLVPTPVTRAAPDPNRERQQRRLEALALELAERQIVGLIRELGPRQLLAVRQQLAALMEFGPRPEVLQAIGEATGLTARQTQAVAGVFRQQLELGHGPGAALRLAQRYADRLLDLRARTIARQEAVTYTNQLVLERGREAARAGGSVTKQWMSARDDRVDAGNPQGVCRMLDNGERIPLDQAFVFAGEPFDGPPGHIGCRCLLEIWQD